MIRTPRLLLRPWRPSDGPACAALDADPEVRRFRPGTLARERSDGQAEGFQRHIERHGFGFRAVEAPGVEVVPKNGGAGVRPRKGERPC